MEKQKLPNEQAIMILGITSFIGCCCTNGILGVVLSGIGLYLAKKSEELYNANPDQYNLGSLNTWKIINLVGLIMSAIFLFYFIYMKVTGKDEELMNHYMEMLKNMQKN